LKTVQYSFIVSIKIE